MAEDRLSAAPVEDFRIRVVTLRRQAQTWAGFFIKPYWRGGCKAAAPL